MATYGPYSLEDLQDNETVDVLVIDDNFHKLSTSTIQLAAAGTPTVQAIGDAANRGTDTAAARSDHRHGMPSFGSPVAQAFGDAVTNGTATTVPRSDHKHGMPSSIEGLSVGRKVVTSGDLVGGVYAIPGNISDVFVDVNCTIQFPAPSTTARKIYVNARAGVALMTAVGGSTVIGTSYDINTGAVISPPTLVVGDSGEWHSDGSNWRY